MKRQSKDKRIEALIAQADKLAALAQREPDQERATALYAASDTLLAEARELCKNPAWVDWILSPRVMTFLQWTTGLMNAYTFVANLNEGNYFLAAVSLAFVFYVAGWKISNNKGK